MGEEVFTGSVFTDSILMIEDERYRCPKCGNETDRDGLVTVFAGTAHSRGTCEFHPCFYCLVDWLRANIPEVERIEKKEEAK